MPTKDRQHAQENEREAVNVADASRMHNAAPSADHSQTMEQLRQAVEERKNDLASRHATENNLLDREHAARQDSIAALHSQERLEASPEKEADRNAEKSSLERYQAGQKALVSDRQEREQRALSERADALNSLEVRSKQQMAAVDRLQTWMEQTKRLSPEAQKELDSLRQRLEGRYQDDRQQVEAAFRRQDQMLNDQREQLERQMERDQQQFEEQLFSGQHGAEHRNALQQALSRQEASRQQLGHAFQAELGLQQRQDQEQQLSAQVSRAKENAILDQKFSRHQAIKELWQEAVAAISARKAVDLSTTERAREAYNRAMDAFKTRLTRENDARAAAARKIFEEAGFEFLKDRNGKLMKNLPILKLEEVQKKLDMDRHADLLRVSGQHLHKIEDNRQDALKVENLVFMIARDNMYMDLKGRENKLAKETRERIVEKYDEESI